MNKPKKAISLFAGIEGFGLAIHKMGWEVVASVEWEQFPQLVIKKNFPNTEIHGDIKQFDGRKYRGAIDIVCGGFPCQPYSLAGKRKGKDDDRHLWPEMLRVIREIQPTWVVGENVPGLVNWSNGVVFEEVQSDLEVEGYEVQSFILPAAGVGAPHRRDRVWIVAYRANARAESVQSERANRVHRSGTTSDTDKCTEGPSRASCEIESNRGKNNDEPKSRGEQAKQHLGCGYVLRATSNSKGEQGKRMQPEQREFSEQGQREFRGINSAMGYGYASNPVRIGQPRQEHGQTQSRRIAETSFSSDWENFPTQSPICNGNDGIPAELVRYILRTGGDCYTEEEAEKEAKRIISKVRAEGIKAGGNAIVHQVALQIFKAIEEFNQVTA